MGLLLDQDCLVGGARHRWLFLGQDRPPQHLVLMVQIRISFRLICAEVFQGLVAGILLRIDWVLHGPSPIYGMGVLIVYGYLDCAADGAWSNFLWLFLVHSRRPPLYFGVDVFDRVESARGGVLLSIRWVLGHHKWQLSFSLVLISLVIASFEFVNAK